MSTTERPMAAVAAEAADRPIALGLRGESLYWLPFAAGVFAFVIGIGAILSDGGDGLTALALLLLAVGIAVPFGLEARDEGIGVEVRRQRGTVALLGITVALLAWVLVTPDWSYGGDINAIISRSALTGPATLILGAIVTGQGIRGLLGNTPTAQDLAVYPILAVPVLLVVIAYGLILGEVVVNGIANLSLQLLTTAWATPLVGTGADAHFVTEIGLRNNIIGTLELILLTSAFALLPGVGAGVFMSEYPGAVARVVEFATTMLRAVSVFVLGAVAFGIVSSMSGVAPGSILSQLVSGVAYDQNGLAHPGTGSFVLASGVLALLVIPVIAKQTQEGLRSVPREIREGSVALGATEGYGLRRILLPWAGLNILTGLLLGAAEASGGLAAIVLIAGLGSDGVGPTNTVTSLDYALFSTLYGYHPYVQAMQAYRYTTALLLLALTLGLAVLALVARRRVGRRYRGGLTAE